MLFVEKFALLTFRGV